MESSKKYVTNKITLMLCMLLFVGSFLYFNSDNTDSLMKGVVLIEEMTSQDSAGASSGGSELGTGIIIGENKILTNHHVAFSGIEPHVYAFNDVKEYKAEIVSDDALSDITILKLTDNDWNEFKKRNNYSTLRIKSAENLKVGDKVYTVGHPWGLSWSFSSGVVSALKRKNDDSPRYMIQTDARIFQGNSGGPLFDSYGNVVGMNTQMIVQKGGSYGFSIPGEILLKVIGDLDRDKKVAWPILGVSIKADSNKGYVSIADVDPTKTGAKSGLMKNDIFESIDNLIIRTPDTLLTYLAPKNPGDIVTMKVFRNKELVTLKIKLDGKLSSEYPQPDYKE
jgi:S1-C subfamily serine protease